MNKHELERRNKIDTKIKQFIARKKRYSLPIRLAELAKELKMGRQNLSTYYIYTFKDEIEEHNKQVKYQHVQKTIDGLLEAGKEVSVVIVANLAHVRAQYVQEGFGDQIRKIRHETDQAKPIYQVIDAFREVNKEDSLTREEVEKYLCKRFSLKPITVEQKYGPLLRDFEPRETHRQKVWLDEVMDICVALVEKGIPPTLSTIQLMKKILSDSKTGKTVVSRRQDLIDAINKRYGTDFKSFKDIRESAVIITREDGQPTLSKSLLFKIDEPTEIELELDH